MPADPEASEVGVFQLDQTTQWECQNRTGLLHVVLVLSVLLVVLCELLCVVACVLLFVATVH